MEVVVGPPVLDLDVEGCEKVEGPVVALTCDTETLVVVKEDKLVAPLLVESVLDVEEVLGDGRHPAASGGHEVTNSVLVMVVVVTRPAV